MNGPDPLYIVQYCAEECKRQGSGELSVYDMVHAWDFAQYHHKKNIEAEAQLTLTAIERIGTLCEPDVNRYGFRTIPIYVGNGWKMVEKAPWDRVEELLRALLVSYYGGLLFSTTDNGWGIEHPTAHNLSKSAEDQFYYEYENIHPFVDGNGRSGKILYNYLSNTLDNPIMPPNFWGSSNP